MTDEPQQPADPATGHRWRWIVGGLALGVLLAAVVAVVAFDRSLTRVEVQGLGDESAMPEPAFEQPSDPAAADDGSSIDPGEDPLEEDLLDALDLPDPDPRALTILVLGSDSREVLTPEEREEFNTGNFWGERTEVVALVRLDPSAANLRLLNVPRDLLVTRCDGTRGRVNAAYGIGESNGVGGMSCVVQTLTQWSGLTIDHAVKVDFRGFVDIVDSIGGVEMLLDQPLRDRRANLDLPQGCVHLDGVDALAFVRARGLDDDYGRIARQQRFLRELRAQIAELGLITDLPRLLRLADATARSVQLDGTLTLNRIRQLVSTHRGQLTGDLDTEVIPGTPRISESSGAYLVEPDEERARELFAWLETGVDPGAEPEPSLPGGGLLPDGELAPIEPSDGATPPDDPPPAGSVAQRCD